MKNEMQNYRNNDYDPFFDFFAPLTYSEKRYERGLQMKTDIKEDDHSYTLEVELPGIDKNDIHVSLNDGYLTIQAKAESKNDANSNDHTRYIHRERFSGVSTRSYYVGDVDAHAITAKFENGVLKVTLPKEKEEKPAEHLISIQ